MEAHKVKYLLQRKQVHSKVSFQILLKETAGLPNGSSARKVLQEEVQACVISDPKRPQIPMTSCHSDWLSLHLLLKLRHCESKCRFLDGLCAVSDCTNMEHTLTPFHHTYICLTPAKFCDTPPPLKKHSREHEVLIKAVTWESQVLSPVLLQFTQW